MLFENLIHDINARGEFCQELASLKIELKSVIDYILSVRYYLGKMNSCTFYISFQENAVLHIVNGDCAIQALKDSGIEGDFLSWLDVLHDGPVSEGLSLDELFEVRADFIADYD